MLEAVANRLRRIYFALFSVLLVAWLFRVTAFAPSDGVLEGASVGALPGVAVFGAVGAFYAGVLALTLWPLEREAKGEFRTDDRAGGWKKSE